MPFLRTQVSARKLQLMPSTASAYEHLTFGADGEPVIARPGFKVKHLIREHVAYGWSAEELALNHPQLTLGEVYSALAWYADHARAVDAKLDGELAGANVAHAKPENRRIARLLQRPGA
jgi:uncharacterized protein (DUF433 family)